MPLLSTSAPGRFSEGVARGVWKVSPSVVVVAVVGGGGGEVGVLEGWVVGVEEEGGFLVVGGWEGDEGSRSISCASEIPEGELICGACVGRPLFPGGGPGGGGGKPSLACGVCPGEGDGAVVVIVGF